MRRAVFQAIIAFALAIFAPWAVAAPPGVTMRAGNLHHSDLGALYSYRPDGAGKPGCIDECAKASPPFLASANAKAQGLWTIEPTADGRRQWVYDGKPLYTHIAPPADRYDSGLAFLALVRIKDVIAEGFAAPVTHRSVAIPPEASSEGMASMVQGYPSASLRAEEEGATRVLTCIDERGVAFDVKIET